MTGMGPRALIPKNPYSLNIFERKRAQVWISNQPGGYYTLPIEGTNVDVVVLNTNLYYTSNKEVDGSGDPAGQFQWLDDLLTAKAQQNRKVWLIFQQWKVIFVM